MIVFGKVAHYQSHQSGIETSLFMPSQALFVSYQSHQSGIETIIIFLFIRTVTNYQSHQSGIETDLQMHGS